MLLPNLNALRMFDAAARHLNFGRAAGELHLTQGAVAQQVRKLEADLGHKLFHRHARGLTLTDAGRGYHAPVRQALALIGEATGKLAPPVHGVSLSVPPSLAAKWLLPRLPAFDAAHPEIELQVVAEESLADLRAGSASLAIRLGTPPRRPGLKTGLTAALLAPLDLVAAAHPDMARTTGDSPDLETLAGATLIQDGHRQWDRLLQQAGLQARGRVLQFNQTALAMDAAVNGQGIALVPRLFLGGQPLIELWRAPEPREEEQAQGFHVIWPERNAAAATVARWLLRQQAGKNRETG